MNVVDIKVCALALVFVVSYISAAIPCVALRRVSMETRSSTRFKLILSLVNCFSGGVFLAASLVNILPEAAEALEPAFDGLHWDSDFPVVEAFVGAGFILVLCIETVAKECCGGHLHQHSHAHDKNRVECVEIVALKELGESSVFRTAASAHLEVNGKYTVKSNTIKDEYDDTSDLNGAPTVVALPVNKHSVVGASESNGSARQNCDTQEVTSEIEGEVMEPDAEPVDLLRMIALASALSIHMVFEGLAVGLLSKSSEVWELLMPICVHKAPVFFSIGLAVGETLGTLCKSLLAIFFVSLVSPIGVALGIVLSDSSIITDGTIMTVVAGILQSISVGTFLYVTFFEILHPEFAKQRKCGSLRLFAVVIGYGLMFILKYF